MIKKPKEVQKWIRRHLCDGDIPYQLDNDQSKVIADNHANCLVTARAGSGKTRTIVAKVAFLLTYKKIPAEKIAVFAFNKKAKEEINERLSQLKFDDKPVFLEKPRIATTFHAYAYKYSENKNLVTEQEQIEILQKINTTEISALNSESEVYRYNQRILQFINKAEQRYFKDYNQLINKIKENTINNTNTLIDDDVTSENSVSYSSENTYPGLKMFYDKLNQYHKELEYRDKINFNQLIANFCKNRNQPIPELEYIFIDEYQDFSKLFLHLILEIRARNPNSKMLCVGDDWQAINSFAGSNIKYFQNFKKYFPQDNIELYIPTNYRSQKLIVKNANYFMAQSIKDYKSCKSGSSLKRGDIYHIGVKTIDLNIYSPRDKTIIQIAGKNSSQNIQKYLKVTSQIISQNPGKTIKILHRNNEFNDSSCSLSTFYEKLKKIILALSIQNEETFDKLISHSTIHKSKGLEADIVVLLEIDAEKFPSRKPIGENRIFDETELTDFYDQCRLFYVAITRPKEKLYILSKTTKINPKTRKLNFLSYLNNDNFTAN